MEDNIAMMKQKLKEISERIDTWTESKFDTLYIDLLDQQAKIQEDLWEIEQGM